MEAVADKYVRRANRRAHVMPEENSSLGTIVVVLVILGLTAFAIYFFLFRPHAGESPAAGGPAPPALPDPRQCGADGYWDGESGACICGEGYEYDGYSCTRAECQNGSALISADDPSQGCDCATATTKPAYGKYCQMLNETTCFGAGTVRVDDSRQFETCDCVTNSDPDLQLKTYSCTYNNSVCHDHGEVKTTGSPLNAFDGCECDDGYAGDACQYSSSSTCGGVGTALNDGTCDCDEGHNGAQCQYNDSKCSGHGTVTDTGFCTCNEGWSGTHCQTADYTCQTGNSAACNDAIAGLCTEPQQKTNYAGAYLEEADCAKCMSGQNPRDSGQGAKLLGLTTDWMGETQAYMLGICKDYQALYEDGKAPLDGTNCGMLAKHSDAIYMCCGGDECKEGDGSYISVDGAT